jgi:hypothetical protein
LAFFILESSAAVILFDPAPSKALCCMPQMLDVFCAVCLGWKPKIQPFFPFTGRKGSAEGTLSVSDALRVFFDPHACGSQTDKPE